MTDARVRLGRHVRREVQGRFSRLFCGVALASAAVALDAGTALADAPPSGALSVTLGGSTDTSASPPPTADQGAAETPYDEYLHRNPSTYEFAFVSVGAEQAWAIAGHVLYFGAGGGVGPPLYRYSKLGSNKAGWDPSLDIAYGNLFLRLSPDKYVDLDVGPKIAITSALYDTANAPEAGFSYGGYVDLRVGSKTIKFGPRFEYERIAYASYYEKGWRLTPLMLRIEH